MGRGRRKTRRKPTLRGLQKYIRKVDLRDRPHLKAVLEPAESHLTPLHFTTTLLVHKYATANTGGILTARLVGGDNAQDKTLSPTDDAGVQIDSNNNTVAKSILHENIGGAGAVSVLECWRPLIYEPHTYLNSLCNSDVGAQGSRRGRELPTVVLSGSFRIRMVEGINSASHWANALRMVEHTAIGDELNGETNYGHDGFAAAQYVRVLGIVVTDMGKGYGLGQDTGTTTLQDSSNPNFRYDDAAGVGSGAADTMDSHLLAPSLGDLFDNVGRDPENNYQHATDYDHDYTNEDMITWKYKSNDKYTTPEHGETTSTSNKQWVDPLRGSRRRRKFHVFLDKKIQFKARGSLSTRVNQEGGQQYDMKWGLKLKNVRCQQDVVNPTVTSTIQRSREQLSKRVFFYFLPSISNCRNGVTRTTGLPSTGHHAFTVARGPEKCFWTEKDSE